MRILRRPKIPFWAELLCLALLSYNLLSSVYRETFTFYSMVFTQNYILLNFMVSSSFFNSRTILESQLKNYNRTPKWRACKTPSFPKVHISLWGAFTLMPIADLRIYFMYPYPSWAIFHLKVANIYFNYFPFYDSRIFKFIILKKFGKLKISLILSYSA